MSDLKSEVKVQEVKDDKGNVIERTTETFVEKVPMELKTRRVEKFSYPTVSEEVVENYEDGKLVDTKVPTADKTLLPGLSDMKDRVMASGKVVDVIAYVAIAGLLCAIAYKLFF